MTILLVAAAILAMWSTEQTLIKHWYDSRNSEKKRKTALAGETTWGLMCLGCLIAAAIVG